MDSGLLYVLVGTGIVSFLTVIYVLVDEGNKKRRYEQHRTAPASSDPPLQQVSTVDTSFDEAPASSEFTEDAPESKPSTEDSSDSSVEIGEG